MVAGFPANAHPSAPALPDCEAGKGRLPFAKRGRDVADARADGAYGQAAGGVAEGIRLSGIGMSIYVEILIRAPMDALWAHTQTPELHERWDLRFSEIAYVPRSIETEPQRFRYATRIGFGLEVAGEGELPDSSVPRSIRFR